MERLANQQRLHQIADVLLDKASTGEALLAAIHELNALYQTLSPLERIDRWQQRDDGSGLQQGVAVSPDCAAGCAMEPLRTTRFLQGVKAAVDNALQRFPATSIHLLYAGCGPYGNLVVPLLSHFTPQQLQVTLLDFHKVSLQSVRTIVESLQLQSYIKGYVQADASQYQHPQDEPIHVVVSETMAAGLNQEMQVAITLNLAPQLVEGGLWVPEQIRLKVALADPATLFIPIDYSAPPPYSGFERFQELATIFQMDYQQACDLAVMKDMPYLPAGEMTMPELVEPGYSPFLFTEITVFEDIRLTGRDCTLNHITGLPADTQCGAGTTTQFVYRLGNRPGLDVFPQVG